MADVPEVDLGRLRLVESFIREGREETLRTFNLTPATLKSLQEEEWWGRFSRIVYADQAQALDRRLTVLIDRAVTQAEERLSKGDIVLDRFGDQHYIPIKGKDAAAVAALFLDKRQLIRGLPSTIVRSESSLDSIAEKLRSIVRRDQDLALTVDTSALQSTALP